MNVCKDLAIPKRVKGLQGVNVVLISGVCLHYTYLVIQLHYLTNTRLCCRDLAIPKRVEGLQGVNVVLLSGGWRHAVAADDQGRMFGWVRNKVNHLLVMLSSVTLSSVLRHVSVIKHVFARVLTPCSTC